MDKYFGMSPRIAKWKINTPFENWLSRKADYSEFWKQLYVFYYKINDKKYYEVGLEIIKKEIENSASAKYSRINIKKVCRDMVYCLHRFGLSFQDYIIFELIDKDINTRASFVSDKLRYHYCDILNKREISYIMTNKFECYKIYKNFFKRSMVGCFNDSDFVSFDNFISKNDSFIFKPLNEHSGHGIQIYHSKEIKSDMFFAESLSKGPFVVEEIIIQDSEFAKIHSKSINTIRVVTFRIKNKVKIFSVIWRIGVGNSFLDNAGAGGIYAIVNPEDGAVESDARNYKGEYFSYHPDTNVKIKGFKLPEWDKAIDFINKLSNHIEGTTLISWDLAYSDKGWCLVEANENGTWQILQSNMMIGKKYELYSLMDEYFSFHPLL